MPKRQRVRIIDQDSGARRASAYSAGVGGAGTSDHGDLSGLSDDDHVQYYNLARLAAAGVDVFTDVDAEGPTSGDILIYTGSVWLAASPVVDAQGAIVTQNGEIVYS